MRTFLIVVGFLVAVVLVVAAGGWYWWHLHGESVMSSARDTMDDGHRRGSAMDDAACAAEVIERQRADKDDSMGTTMNRAMWLAACLETSSANPSLCEGVPGPTEIFKMEAWTAAACERQKMANPFCQSIYQHI